MIEAQWREAQRSAAKHKIHTERMQLHRERVASVKRPIIWERLLDRIRAAVNSQNLLAYDSTARLSGLKVTLSMGSARETLNAKTLTFPLATVEISFLEKRLIQIAYSYQQSDLSDVRTWKEFLEFKVDENENVLLQHKGEPIDIDGAAMLILRPLRRDPAFKPPTNAHSSDS